MVSISEKLNLKPQLSGADIKSLYEAEADTNAYTDAEKTSVSTALQPDQAETISGNYTFNGALTLPNNSRINGTEHFYQTTKPTTRGDSSALVAGDRWWKTNDRTEWFWNGTYWLSERITVGNSISVTDMNWAVGMDEANLFLHSVVAKGRVATDPPNWDASNYWECNILYNGGTINNLAILDSTSGYYGGPDLHFYRKFVINSALIGSIPSTAGSNMVYSQIRKTGNPTGPGAGSASLSYFFEISFWRP